VLQRHVESDTSRATVGLPGRFVGQLTEHIVVHRLDCWVELTLTRCFTRRR
jgi:hypothetical protein